MHKLYTALLIVTTAVLFAGCSSTGIPPIDINYTDGDGNVVSIGMADGGINVTYVETCQSCAAPIEVAATTPEKPALCDSCTDAKAAAVPATPPVVQLYPAYGVSAGLTSVNPAAYRGWKGDCPGTDIDAWFMAGILDAHNIPCTLLYNNQVTADGIISAVTSACRSIQPGGLLILYLSGHGSQQRDTNGDEADGQDEQLCLWDGYMSDDVVWELLQRVPAGIRVFMITDTCHSGTNFRGPASIAPAILLARSEPGSTVPDILHYGGCSDGRFSYGSSQGGVFTTALVDTWDPLLTYAEWFAAACKKMPHNQRPTMEMTGELFSDRQILK